MSAILETEKRLSEVEGVIMQKGYKIVLAAKPLIAVSGDFARDVKHVINDLYGIDGVKILVAARETDYAGKSLLSTIEKNFRS